MALTAEDGLLLLLEHVVDAPVTTRVDKLKNGERFVATGGGHVGNGLTRGAALASLADQVVRSRT